MAAVKPPFAIDIPGVTLTRGAVMAQGFARLSYDSQLTRFCDRKLYLR